jgi:hypothetical protein
MRRPGGEDAALGVTDVPMLPGQHLVAFAEQFAE